MSKLVVNRPARLPAPVVPEGVKRVSPPPRLAEAGQVNLLQSLLPALAGLGAMIYIVSNPNPLAIIAGGLFATTTLLMGAGIYVTSRSASRRRIVTDRMRYLDYLDEVSAEAAETATAQRQAAWWRHPDPASLWPAAASPLRLWERRPADADALQARVGVGSVPLATPLSLAPLEDPLVERDPVCVAAADALVERRSLVSGIPITIAFDETRVLSLLGARHDLLSLSAAMLGQLVTFTSPRDLRVAVLCDANRLGDWAWVKWLPHAQQTRLMDRTGPARQVTGNRDELVEVLGDELAERRAAAVSGTQVAGPHLVLVVDRSSSGDLGELLWAAPPAATTIVHLGAVRDDEPPVVDRRVVLGVDGRLDVERGDGSAEVVGAIADTCSFAEAEALARLLAPLTLSARSASGIGGRPSIEGGPDAAAIELPDLLGIPHLERFDPRETWSRTRPVRELLRVAIGVDADGNPVHLDLKESALGGMGPHGLMIGATGSGKSELLRTLVTGLALTHPPEQLSFCLVDFKGGAAFAGLAGLPHVAGLITNLADDLALIDRMHDALFGEMHRRQELLKDAGNLSSVREYQAMRDSGERLEPLPILLVVIDEFSELLTAKPEFADLFVAIGRLGRSLGIHLLFASQRLEEGKLRGLESHLSYRVALRTFSGHESRTVIGTEDAYKLPPLPGSAFLKVDTTVYTRFRAALVSGQWQPPGPAAEHPVEVQQPGVVPFGATSRGVRYELPPPPVAPPLPDIPGDNVNRMPTLLDVAVSRIRAVGRPTRTIWLDPLPPALTLDAVLPEPCIVPGRGLVAGDERAWGGLQIPVGLLDRPAEQRQDVLVLDLAGAGGNLAVTGAPQSGKSVLLRTLVTAMALTHTPRDVQIYGIDHGGGGLATIAALPHVGGIATRLERERVRRILSELTELLARREALFAEHGIDSVSVFRAMRAAGDLPGEQLGDVFLVIDNFGALRSEMDDADEVVFDLASRGLGYGLHVIIATNRANDMRMNLRDTLGTRLELRIGDPLDSEIDRKASELLTGSGPGRGLTTGKLFFQAALPRADGVADPLTLGRASEHLAGIAAREWSGPAAPAVRTLPHRIDAAELPATPDEPGVVVGVTERNLGPVRLDLRGGDPHFLVYGDSESGKTAFLRTYLRGLVTSEPPERAKVVMVDLRRTLLEVVPESHLASYSGSLATAAAELQKLRNTLIERLPPVDVTVSQLRDRSWWSGPDVYVVADDYDLVVTPAGNPLAPLLELVPQARDVGLHVIIARRVAGAGRASFEPFLQRVREMGEQGLILAGDPSEGQILGGIKATPQPAGRGVLIRRRAAPELIQVAWTSDHAPVA